MGQVPQFDVHYMAEVLADILGREHGCEITITLTPKEEITLPQEESGG